MIQQKVQNPLAVEILKKEFPEGTFRVDLAQPLANMAFYCLEPQAADGFNPSPQLVGSLRSHALPLRVGSVL